MKETSQKNVYALGKNIKRLFCKKCDRFYAAVDDAVHGTLL